MDDVGVVGPGSFHPVLATLLLLSPTATAAALLLLLVQCFRRRRIQTSGGSILPYSLLTEIPQPTGTERVKLAASGQNI
jgi:ABC-type multidrug transport system permease subunit